MSWPVLTTQRCVTVPLGLQETLVFTSYSPEEHLGAHMRADYCHCVMRSPVQKLTLVAILTCESGIVSRGTIPAGVAHIAIVCGDVGTITVLCGELVMRELTHVHVGVGCHDGGCCTSTGTRCRWHVTHYTYCAAPTGAAAGTAAAGTTTIRRRWRTRSGQF